MAPARLEKRDLAPRPLRERSIVLGIGGAAAVPRAWICLRELGRIGIETTLLAAPEALRAATAEGLRTWAAEVSGRSRSSDAALRPPHVWTDPVALSAHLEGGGRLRGDALAVLGATPDLIGRIAKGIPGDPISLAALSWGGPVLVERDPAARGSYVVDNSGRLAEWGWRLLDAAPGGSSLEEAAGPFLDGLVRLLLDGEAGCPVLVTAGPTREPIDPVRYLSNRSSGRMGFAVARAARDRGHRVTLVAGPDLGITCPHGVDKITVETADDMSRAVRARHMDHPILVMAAAVADYRPSSYSEVKIRRDRATRQMNLEANPDILASLRDERRALVTVGFAIEGGLDGEALRGARKKLESKGLSFIVLNDPQRPDSAFGGPTTRVRILRSSPRDADLEVDELPTMSKDDLGREVIRRAVTMLAARNGIRI